MALSVAPSHTVVDLSHDNDTTGTLAAAPTLPSSSATESFERSCDNPECSAPRLISQVPKRDTSEFLTEPMIVHQPTIINGFTTVFQIDGIGTRMEDIMNESAAAAESNSTGENRKPKTVFRVVPNTHAHIVNYVVVDAAGETMKKIQANDPETMCKLLISQRLSADQMLKKLIGKALETPSRIENPSTAPAPDAVSTPIGVSTPQVPSGITIKLVPNPETNMTASSSIATAAAVNASSNNQISLKPSSEVNKTGSALKPTNAATIASTNKQIPKLSKPITQNTKITPLKPAIASQAILRPTAGGRVLTASKPIVWQAVPPEIASKCTSPLKTSPPRTAPTICPRNTQLMLSNPNTSSSQQPLKTPELVDVEKPISASSIAVQRRPIDSDSIKQQNVLKRKPDSITPVLEAIKRLRPRSPTRILNQTPLAANNMSKIKDSPPVTRKLPTLPKFQKTPIPQKPPSLGKSFLNSPKAQDKPIEVIDDIPMSDVTANKKDTAPTTVDEKSVEPNAPIELDTPTKRKIKPLMGPASKMKALKAIADAKTDEATKQCKPSLITQSGPIKIGETIITRTGSLKNPKENLEPAETITKPCSVAITDISKSNTTDESDTDSKTKRSKSTLRLPAEKEARNTPNKKTNAYEALVDRYRGRWTIKKEDEALARKSFVRATRSSATTKATANTLRKPEVITTPCDDISDSTLLTTPSAPSRVLRVVLPSTKNGIVNNPSTSPHPNLKISSVISSGSTLPPSMIEVDTETAPILINENSGQGIEQLQKELADLRRTVARLTQGKIV